MMPEKTNLKYLLSLALLVLMITFLLPFQALAEGEFIDLSGAAVISVSPENGQTTAIAAVSEEKLLNSLGTNPAAGKMVLKLNNTEDTIKVRLTAYSLSFLSGTGMPFEIRTPGGSFIVPAAGIDMSGAAAKLGTEPEFYDFVIAKPSYLKVSAIDAYIRNNGLTALSASLEFRIEALAGDKSAAVSSLQSYCQKGILFNGAVDESTAVGLRLDSAGRLSPVPTQFVSENGQITALIKDKTNGAYIIIGHRQVFSDLAGYWAKDDIALLASKLIVTGVNDQQFGPEQKTTRAQFTTMIVKALGLEAAAGRTSFKDIKPGAWYAGAVSAAVNTGIISGYADGRFQPGRLITREEITAVIVKALVSVTGEPLAGQAEIDYYLKPFSDKNKISPWAQKYIATAVRNRIIGGDSKGCLNPRSYSTRAEAAVMLKKMMLKAGFISPAFTITSPGNNMKTNKNIINVTGVVAEGSTVTVNGIPADYDFSGAFSTPVELTPGTNDIVIVVTDSAGSVSTVNRTVIFDESVAIIDLYDIPENFVTGRSPFTVRGRVEPGSSATVNGMKVSTDPQGSFSITIPLNSGKNLIIVKSVDTAGNENSLSRTVIYDKTPPNLVVLTPSKNYATDNNALIVTGYTEPGCKVEINGQAVQVDTMGNFSNTIDLQTTGVEVKVTATDPAGNISTVDRKVVLESVSLTNLEVPDKIGLGRNAQIKYKLNLDAYLTVKIYKENGELFRTLVDNALRKQGNNTENWDGKDLKRVLAPEGTYRFEFEAKGTGSADVSRQSKTARAYRIPVILGVNVNPKIINPANGESAYIKFKTTENCLLTVSIIQGRQTVKSIVYEEHKSWGAQEVRWDGRDDRGNMLADASYTCSIDAANVSDPSFIGTAKAIIAVESQAPVISDLKTPDFFSIGGSNLFKFVLSERAKVNMQILGSDGRVVYTLVKDGYRNAGPNNIFWSGRTSQNTVINDGTYTLTISAQDGSGKSSNTVTQSFRAGVLPKISSISVTPKEFNPRIANSRAAFRFSLSNRAAVTLNIYKGSLLVKSIIANRLEGPGAKTYFWDGKDSAGKTVGNGYYFYRIIAAVPEYTKAASVANGSLNVKSIVPAAAVRGSDFSVIKLGLSTPEVEIHRSEAVYPAQVGQLTVRNLQAEPNLFNPAVLEETTNISYTLLGDAIVNLTVNSGTGMVVSLVANEYQNAGDYFYTWDGKDRNGNAVSDGTYILLIELTDPENPARNSFYKGSVKVDAGAPGISEITITPESLRLYGGQSVDIKFDISESGKVSVEIFKGDALVKTLARSRQMSAGVYTFKWDGRDNSGSYVEPGNYTVFVKAVDANNYTGTASAGITVVPHLEVSATEPENGSGGVSVSTNITVTFNDTVREGVSFDDVSLQVDGNNIPAEKKLNGNKIIITPINNLVYGTSYTVTIPADAVFDLKGKPMAAQYVYKFTTAGASRGAGRQSKLDLSGVMTTVFAVDGKRSLTTIDLNDYEVNTAINRNGGAQAVVVPVTLDSDEVNISISGGLLKNLAARKTAVEVSTPKALLTIPASVLDPEKLFGQLGSSTSGLTFNIVITSLTPQEEAALRSRVKKQGLTPLLLFFSFRMEVLTGNTKRNIDRTAGYCALTFTLPQTYDLNSIAGVMPDGNSLMPVPTWSAARNGASVVLKSRSGGTFAVVQSKKTFRDLKGHWAKSVIENLAAKMILGGVSSNSFAPQRSVTRAEFVTMIMKALGLGSNAGTIKAGFVDIKGDSWYAGEVAAAVEAGIVSGYVNRTFRPNAQITREEAAVIAVRALETAGVRVDITADETNKLLGRFKDNKNIGSWSQKSTAQAVKSGLVKGYSSGLFIPGKNITRAEAAVIVKQILTSAGLTNVG